MLAAMTAAVLLHSPLAGQHEHGGAAPGSMFAPFGVSMDRMGSGTTWIPDAVSVPSGQYALGSWSLMLHGFGFAQYIRQGGPRGDDQVGSLNWAMLMASRNLAGGRFQARTMLSLDPATVTGRGYPLLLQSGESYEDEPLHDRQHPHDFWMELGVLYERPVSSSFGVAVYAAPSGEPALGPVAFMHRPSAMDDPMASLGHHWQDATHISLFGSRWKLEGSAFNGREPDEHRWNFDRIRLDSYSTRLTVSPDSSWSLTAGYGYLDSPEAHEPEVSVDRLAASVMYGKRVGPDGQLAATLVYGGNRSAAEGQPGRWAHSLLLESEAILDRHHTLLGRAEMVQKRAEDLAIDGIDPERRFDLASLSLGGIREVGRWGGMTLGAGVRGTMSFLPATLEPHYGSRTPLGAVLFLRIRPHHRGGADPHAGMKM
jgi:hypothetical protein